MVTDTDIPLHQAGMRMMQRVDLRLGEGRCDNSQFRNLSLCFAMFR